MHATTPCARRIRPLCTVLLLTAAAAPTSAEIEVVPLAEQPWHEAADRAVAREIASPRNSSAKRLSIAEIRVPPGVTVRPHHHLMQEIYHVVDGEGVMMVEDAERRIAPGDTVVIPPHAWHGVANPTSEDLLLVVTCAPAWAPEHLIFERDRMPDDPALD